MKAILLITAFLICLGQQVWSQDQGFNALEWGDAPKQSMTLQDSRGRYKFYSDPLDKVNKGLIMYGIEDLTYGFCAGQFCEILGRIKGRENFDKMYFGIAAERGEPSVNKHVTIWFSQTDVLIYFEEETDTGYFLFHNNPVYLSILREDREAEKARKETKYLAKKEKKKKER